MLYIHYILVLSITIIGVIGISRLFYNILKYKAPSDIYLTISYIFFGSFTSYEFLILNPLIFAVPDPTAFSGYDPFIIHFMQVYRIVAVIIGIGFFMFEVRYVLKSVAIKYKFKRWIRIICAFLFILFLLIVIFNFRFVNLDGYLVSVISLTIPAIILTIVLVTLLLIIYTPNYFGFLAMVSKDKFRKSRKELTFAIITFISVCLYILNVGIRVFFGDNWPTIIFSDILGLISIILGFIASFSFGFGESMVCILNLESMYVSHYSGRLLYSHHFVEQDADKDDLISAFLVTINDLIKEIRVEGTGLERLVLGSGSQIVLAQGRYCWGIVIVKKFNILFIHKLNSLMSKIDELDVKLDKSWSGETDLISSMIEHFRKEVF